MYLLLNILTALQLFFSGEIKTYPVEPSHNGAFEPHRKEFNIPGNVQQFPFIGEIMFENESTVALEKLVTPWLLYYTNRYRKEHGLDTLNYDPCLLKAAAFHTAYLYNESKDKGKFKLGHAEEPSSPWFKGKSASDRALTAGCQKYCGENALYFTLPGLTPNDAVKPAVLQALAKKIAFRMVYEQWHESKPHRENMLTKAYTTLGAAVSIGINNANGAVSAAGDNLVVFGVQVLAF